MDIWWTLHLKREPASVPLARRILLGTMESAGVDAQIAHEIGIALTEACANAVEHAAGGQPDEGFQVTASIDGDRLRIEVMDWGPGLPPAEAAARRPTLSVPLLAPSTGASAPRAQRRPSAVPVTPVHKAPARPAPRCQGKHGRTTVISRAAVMASLSPAASARRLRGAEHPGPYDTHVLDAGFAVTAGLPGLPLDIGTELPDPTAESGRGLFLIRALADHVQFRNHPRRGTIVSFDKVLKWRENALLRAVS
ncbi:ATP-binding protein [Peterkaempfera bronchialis]|uniref:ATP-binding protein n=1 Tax=Peterkaempfera bronchialis TaxID=2126346 RepID=UPI00224572C6|nr:ATP-binding protein [Peterkaempfera bronchialis]